MNLLKLLEGFTMKKLFYLLLIVAVAALVYSGCQDTPNLTAPPATEQPALTGFAKTYSNVTLSGGFQVGHFNDWWDLTAGDITLSFTYDATGLVDDFGGNAHAWAEIGLRSPCYGDFNPTWMAEGAGVWLATDYEWSVNTFNPDPVGSPTLDLDDKLILQKGGGNGEGSYDLPSPPPNAGNNHRIWFDRDGVDQWQAASPLAVNGANYNTNGIYQIVITLHANDATSGTAYMSINGLDQGFETNGNWNTMELTPAGMTFTGDMTHLQVFYGLYGYGAIHTVSFTDITVSGTETTPPLAPCFETAIDIKPGSYPNSINLRSRGVVPVAILTTPTFDATTVDPATVEFAGAASVHWAVEDVDGDGDMDMILHFKTQNLNLTAGSTEAYLTGYTTAGVFFWGMDTVNIVPK